MPGLFRVEMWGQDKTMKVFGDHKDQRQTFLADRGPYLQTIDMVEGMGNGPLRMANGPATIRAGRSPTVEKLMREND